VDGVGSVEDGVEADSFLEDEGGVVKGAEKGRYGEGGVRDWYDPCLICQHGFRLVRQDLHGHKLCR